MKIKGIVLALGKEQVKDIMKKVMVMKMMKIMMIKMIMIKMKNKITNKMTMRKKRMMITPQTTHI